MSLSRSDEHHTHTGLRLCRSLSLGDIAHPPGLPPDDQGALRQTTETTEKLSLSFAQASLFCQFELGSARV